MNLSRQMELQPRGHKNCTRCFYNQVWRSPTNSNSTSKFYFYLKLFIVIPCNHATKDSCVCLCCLMEFCNDVSPPSWLNRLWPTNWFVTTKLVSQINILNNTITNYWTTVRKYRNIFFWLYIAFYAWSYHDQPVVNQLTESFF